MNDCEHTGRLPATRTTWALLHPLLTAISQAGVPFGAGDLERLHDAAALGPDFVQALTRWIIAAHRAAPPSGPTVWVAGHTPRVQLTPVPAPLPAPLPLPLPAPLPPPAALPLSAPTGVPGSRSGNERRSGGDRRAEVDRRAEGDRRAS
ncbi:hypothetical protein [Kitasatospora sp. NBC_01302]|uniref:hypothetical protein n=1 Tax=Kitasatospora sp. NBC_01302 TaxID=2903575 RepID=UPI002E0E089A|nr:hypothetical protein OG294_34095 [Kitasatospora sp. NBC_01302]